MGLGPAHLTALAGIFAILGLATLVQVSLVQMQPDRDWSELGARIRSWWVMVAAFSAALLLGTGTTLIWFALVSWVGLKEFLSMVPTRRADRRLLLLAYMAVPVQFWWIWIGWYGMFVVFIPVYMFLAMAGAMVLGAETRGFVRAVGTLHWALISCVFAVSHAAALLILPDPARRADGVGLLLFLVITTEGNDVAQYAWGRLLGRRPILPSVSPKKTVEGFLGGLATTAALGMVLGPSLTPFNTVVGGAMGIGIAAAGFLGDVTVSAVKRDVGIKDFGATIPGHGGILDRIDSLIFSAPLFFHVVRYFYY